MSISRYKDIEIIRNVDDDYKIVFASRFPYNGIKQFSSENLRYPNFDEITSMEIINHTWKYGSRLYKLANDYYGSPSYWWVMAWFNKIGSENDISFGNSIMIPKPLDYVLLTYGL